MTAPTQPARAELRALRERVQALTRPDPHVDALVWDTLTERYDLGTEYWQGLAHQRITAFIDSSLALVERVLARTFVRITLYPYQDALAHCEIGVGDAPNVYTKAPTAPLAILLALLTALIEREERE